MPCGLASNGMPIGVQLVSRHFDEARLLKAAHNLEQATGFNFKPKAIEGI
jgi:aspartyl-tRNA(Asn)/glutamyl-tRNA(Gln) amidotransferase subunit A